MKLDHIFELSESFYSLASEKEKVPPKTEDLNVLLKNLSQLTTFQAKVKYAKNNLKRISSGSSRIVYDFPENQVLKLASNEKGIVQNQAEASVKTDSQFINKITKVCPNYSWVVAPKAEKVTEKEFKDLSGVPFKEFGKVLVNKIKPDEDSNKKYKDYLDLPIIVELAEIVKKYQLMTGDIARISSWGKIDNQLKLVDLGLNKKIYQKYYASEKSQKEMKKNPSSYV